MRQNTLIPAGILVLALGAGGYTAEAGQRDRNGRDRNGRESQGQTRQGQGRESQGQTRERPDGGDRAGDGAQDRGGARAEQQQGGGTVRGGQGSGQDRGGRYQAPERRDDQRAFRQAVPRAYERQDNRRDAYRYDTRRYDNYRYDGYRGDTYRYYGYPRIVRPGPRHYYGRGGEFSVYYGLGSGYLYGSPWSGRVYGYTAPRAYGSRIYYGDIRLQVQPRNAAVYVDGYYAGVVDDFDGVFQRLTLEVGPHQIELDAPGLEPQFFDVYVDPARTVNIRTDLFR
jgi:hypothetical protein